ncbi:MAG: EAL domain-containing protein [Polyangia bacterium]|jgi:diguanylate cyclase (GGDEF)-like protein/PAS domain S-box-containing protein|nr:EAL domain-containing protein [Polyangia bacterium]
MRNDQRLHILLLGLSDDTSGLVEAVLNDRGHRSHHWDGRPGGESTLPDERFHLALVGWEGPAAADRCRRLRQLPQAEHALQYALVEPERLSEVPMMLEAGVVDCIHLPLCVVRLEARLIFMERFVHSEMERKWVEVALRESEERSRDLFENAPIGIYQTTPDGRMLMANPHMARMLGYESFEELAANNLEESGFWPSYPRARFKEQIENEGQIQGYEAVWIRRDGKALFVRENARVVRDASGAVLYYTGTAEDISEQRRAEEALQKSEERFALAASGAHDGLWEWDLESGQLYVSPRWLDIHGLDGTGPNSMVELWFERVHPEDLTLLRAEIQAHLDGVSAHFEREYRVLHADGSYRWMLTRGLAVREPGSTPVRMAGSTVDITERRQTEEQLLHHALHDRLTGLPNRALFMDRLRRALAQARHSPGYDMAVVLLDLDRFKMVNESLGHEVGERIIKEVGTRLKEIVKPGDTLSRVGGDEFAILLEGLREPGEARKLVDRVQEHLTRPFQHQGNEIFVTASVGIAPCTPEYERAGDLVRDAEVAMYRAKTMGRERCAVFAPAMRERAVAWLQIEGHLRHALERDQLLLYYQPIVSLETGQISGFEALIRWRHPELGLVSPSKFVHVAEETGLIIPMGQWVLLNAARQLKRWQTELPSHRDLTVNVNLSARQLNDRQLVGSVSKILEETQIPAHSLRLEITESVLMEDRTSAMKLLRELKSLKVQLSIDDFGTGYSSFSHLELFPISSLKIDRSFIHRMGLAGEHPDVVDTIITLGRNLGLHVVAEGVETDGQLAQLRQLRCEFAQGFLFSPPLGSQQAEELLVRNPRW